MSAAAVLRCAGLAASYGGHAVFRSVSLSFGTGAHAVQGANGTGKSTLLRLLAGAQAADAGRVWVDGFDLMQASEQAKRRLSFVPDESPIYPFMTGHELLDFVAAAKRAAIDDMVRGLIGAFGLSRHLPTRFDAMSLGTRKKMMLCAAWIGAPRLVLLDEPANGLDLEARDCLVRLLRQHGRDAAVVFSAHDAEFVHATDAHVIAMETLLAQ